MNEEIKINKKRIMTLDLIKLVAILFVVYGHTMSAFIQDPGNTTIMNIIWLIQMPAFFIVSGMLCSSISKINSVKTLLFSICKKTIVYLVPCLSYAIITPLLFNQSISILDSIASIITNPPLWFLVALWQFVVFFDIAVYVSSKFKNKYVQYLIPVVFLGFIALIYTILFYKGILPSTFLCIKYVSYYTVFYLAGYIIKIIKTYDFTKTQWFKITYWVVFSIATCLFLFEIFYFKNIMNFDDSIINIIIRIIGSFSGFFLLYILCDLACKTSIGNTIAKGGKYSLNIYYLHYVLHFFAPDQVMTDSINWATINTIYFVVLCTVLACILLIYYIPFLHLILFGRSWSKYDFEKKLFSNNKIIT